MHDLLIPSKVNGSYDLVFHSNLEEIIKLIEEKGNITIIDSNIDLLYPELKREGNIIVECIEEKKNLDSVNLILDELIIRNSNIKTKLIIIGGGILQDLVGFAASIYCRGIEYILVPTTLLAQTDSCVGGKTSINYNNRKNILGTFYPPSKIIICTEFVKTLSNIDYLSGMGEIYKFHILQNKINDFDLDSDVDSMIYDGLKYKTKILELDEFDKKERKFLNFGHTFGHAIESTSNYEIPHGLAVVLGSMIAIRISNLLGFMYEEYSDAIIEKGVNLFRMSEIELKEEWFDFDKLLQITKSDKKSNGNLIMVLQSDEPFLRTIEEMEIIKTSIKQTYESI